MAFFCDENDVQIDDNLFEFWGAFCDPHELDDAFAATTTSIVLPTTSSSSASASTNNISVSSTYSSESSIETPTPTPIKLAGAPSIMHCQANYANGAYSSSQFQSHDNIRTLSLKPSTSITVASTIPDDSVLPATVSDDETFSSNAQSVSGSTTN